MERRGAERGLRLEASFESEFTAWDGDGRPLHEQPAYGLEATRAAGPFLLALVRRLQALGVEVDQVHPEYSPGQLEVSVGRTGPVAAADRVVLVRDVIRTVARELGLRVSLSAKPSPDVLGNGAHLHLSLWRGDDNLFGSGDDALRHGARGARLPGGPAGRAARAARRRLRQPGLLPAARPEPLDGRLRLLGSREPRGAAAADPGLAQHPPARREHRAEARRRLRQPVPGGRRRHRRGPRGHRRRPRAAAGVHDRPGHHDRRRPARPPASRRCRPTSRTATDALRASTVLRAAMGETLHDSLVAVRVREHDDAMGISAEGLCERYRFRY